MIVRQVYSMVDLDRYRAYNKACELKGVVSKSILEFICVQKGLKDFGGWTMVNWDTYDLRKEKDGYYSVLKEDE